MRISDLTLNNSLSSGDIFPIVHNNTTVKTNLRSLINYLAFNSESIRNVSGNFIVSGEAMVTGDLRVSGSTYLGGDATDVVRVIGQFKQSGNSYLSGNAIITGNLDVSGNVFFGTGSGNSHRVSGNLTVQGTGYFGNKVTVEKTFTAKENFTLNHSATIGTDSADIHAIYGQITFYHNVSVQGATSFIGSDNYFAGNNWVNGSLTTSGGLITRGNVNFNKSFSNLTRISGQIINHSNAYFLQQVFAFGNSDFSGNLSVFGNTNLGDNIADLVTISGSQITRGNGVNLGSWTVGGASRLTGDMLLQGVGYVANDLNVLGNTRVSGKSLFGNSPSDTTSIVGDAIVSRNLSITGNLGLSGRLTVGTSILDVGSRWLKFSGVSRTITSASTLGSEIGFNVGQTFRNYCNTGDYFSITGATNSNLYNGTFRITRKGVGGTTNMVYADVGANVPPVSPAAGTISLDCYIPSGAHSDIQSLTRVGAGKYRVRFQRDLATTLYVPILSAALQEAATAYFPQVVLGHDDGAGSYAIPNSGKVNDFYIGTFVPTVGYVDMHWIWMKLVPM